MYKRIDFSNLGGNPIDQQSIELMQQSYSDTLAAIAAFIGNKVIITGVTINAGVVSDGWIVYNGEIIKFVGGNYADGVVVQETATYSPTYEDAATHDVEFLKTATCGLPATFNFGELVRLDTIANVFTAFSNFVNAFKKSDDPTKNDTTFLATTVATKNLQDQINAFKGVAYAGTVHIGDLSDTEAQRNYDATQLQILTGSNQWESIFKLTFPAAFTMPDNNYLVITQLKNNAYNTGAQFNSNRGTVVMIGQKMTNGFYLSVNISASNDPGTQDLYLDYFLIKI